MSRESELGAVKSSDVTRKKSTHSSSDDVSLPVMSRDASADVTSRASTSMTRKAVCGSRPGTSALRASRAGGRQSAVDEWEGASA